MPASSVCRRARARTSSATDGQAEHARPALARALAGHPGADPRPARRAGRCSSPERPQHRGADDAARGADGVRVPGDRVEAVRGDPAAAVAAGQVAARLLEWRRRTGRGCSSTDVPVGTSTTPGERDGAPDGDQGRAGRRRRADRRRTTRRRAGRSRARCARVSTFCTRVGRPAAPRWKGRSGYTGAADALADPVREGALLAGHVARRRRHQPDGQRVDAGGLALVEGRDRGPGTRAEPRCTAMKASVAPTVRGGQR